MIGQSKTPLTGGERGLLLMRGEIVSVINYPLITIKGKCV